MNREYLKRMLQPEYFQKTVVAIVLNCEEPWNAMKSFQQWIEVLMDILEEHMRGLPLETQDALRNKSAILGPNFRSHQLHKEVRGAGAGRRGQPEAVLYVSSAR